MKKTQNIKQQKEEEHKVVKPAVRIQELKNKLIISGHDLSK